MSANLVTLLEYVSSSTDLKVDREKGILRGVKALGWSSVNGRRYLPDGVDPKLYEGARVYLNHTQGQGKPGRDVRDGFGWLANPEKRADGVYADLHLLNPKSEFAESVFRSAELKPDYFGLSHEARGRMVKGTKESVVEALEQLDRVSLVDGPASVKGLFESRNPTVKRTPKQLLEHALAGKPARLKLLEEAPYPGMMAGPEMDVPDDLSADDAGVEAMCNMIRAAAGEGDWDKVKKIVSAFQKLLDNTPAPADTPAAPAAESRTHTQPDDPAVKELQESLRLLREESAVRDLIEEAGLTFATPAGRKTFVKSLLSLTEAERKELIEERQARPKPQDPPTEPRPKPAPQPPPRPRSAPPDTVRESKAAADPLAVPAGDRKAVMAWLKE